MPAMTHFDRVRLQSHLRRVLHSPDIILDPSELQGGTAELSVGGDVLGTVDEINKEGERSWAVLLIVLADDLVG